MKLFALSGEREVLVTEHTVYDEDGRELTGVELDELMTQLDHARLNTKWREMHRDIPLGSWVAATGGAFKGRGRVVGFCTAKPWTSDHGVTVTVSPSVTIHVGPADIQVIPDPEGEG